MLFTDILKVFESAYFFLYFVNVYVICQFKGCLCYNYDNHTLSSCLDSFGHMMLCMQFSHVAREGSHIACNERQAFFTFEDTK